MGVGSDRNPVPHRHLQNIPPILIHIIYIYRSVFHFIYLFIYLQLHAMAMTST